MLKSDYHVFSKDGEMGMRNGIMWKIMLSAGMLCSALYAAAETRVLAEWTFDGADAKPWSANHSKDVRIENGVLKGTITDWDPFIASPAFPVDATAGQAVVMRVRTTAGGNGNLYWTKEGEKMPQGKFNVPIVWIGDNEWHEYRVTPYWQSEKRISSFRIDFATPPNNSGTYEVDWVRLEEAALTMTTERAWRGAALGAWNAVDGAAAALRGDAFEMVSGKGQTGALTSPVLNVPSGEVYIVPIEMAATEGDEACIQWASDAVSGLHSKTFWIKPDGRFHIYNVDVGSDRNWKGNIVLLRVVPVDRKGASAKIRSIAVTDEPEGDADVSVMQARMSDAINRVGRTFPVLIQLSNMGGKDAKNVRLAVKALPRGVRVASASGWEKVPEIPAPGVLTHTVMLEADGAVAGDAVFAVSGDGADGQTAVARLDILPDLKLPKAAYVPEPKPLKSDYEIGALYYPGWDTIEKWARIWPVAPERKPVLGWYDEAKPEVVDWQIKWMVENGMSYLLLDWYWHKGHQHNDHWIKAFKKARYRSYLKWAVMWANHNEAGSHSEEDQRAVTKFWIDEYFNMPEYYQIDGKPVVIIWNSKDMDRDMGAGGCKRLLEISRALAVEAGYKGIYFIAMKWPEASWDPKVVQGYKDQGFDMTTIYHFMHHGGKAANTRRFHFDLVADCNYDNWKGLHETGILPFIPNLSTGWDDRPWHADKGIEIHGRTVEHFRRICRDAKRFADETGIKRLTVAPLNEWGEGSYAEPNAEFGFGMYEAIRETFCEKPAAGWPLNYAPQDVGLGPYDLPPPAKDNSREWVFANGKQGWSVLMGITDFKAGAEGLTFKSVTRDPAIQRTLNAVPAKQIAQVVVRMKVTGEEPGNVCQLFWMAGVISSSEDASLSLPVKADGEFHDYVFEVGQSRRWNGRITGFRLDPVSRRDMAVTVESIRLVPAAK